MSEAPQPEPQPAPPAPDDEPEDERHGELAAEDEAGDGGETPEEPAQPEPETEPPQAQSLTPKELNARDSKAQKSWENYVKRIGDLWEEDATNLIPLTISPSAPPGFLHAEDRGRIPEEVMKPLLDFFGMQQEADYAVDRSRPACEKCNGKGKVRTGSEVPEFRTLLCDLCNGRGFIQAGMQRENGPGAPELVPVPVGAEPPDLPQGDVDGWGIPRLMDDGMPNPNFGRTPQYWDYNFPTGHVG